MDTLIRLTGTIVPCVDKQQILDCYYEVAFYEADSGKESYVFSGNMLAKLIRPHTYLEVTGVELSSFIQAREREQRPCCGESGGGFEVPISNSRLESLQHELSLQQPKDSNPSCH